VPFATRILSFGDESSVWEVLMQDSFWDSSNARFTVRTRPNSDFEAGP
jgi:hypothetical protein